MRLYKRFITWRTIKALEKKGLVRKVAWGRYEAIVKLGNPVNLTDFR